MFVSKRTVNKKAYFYLEDRINQKRLSVYLGEKARVAEGIEAAFEELIQKKAIESVKRTQQEFKTTVLSPGEILLLERLKIDYLLLKEFFPAGFESFKEDEFVRYAQGSASVEGNSLSLKEAALVLTKGAAVAGKSIDEVREVENMKKAALVSKKIKKINERAILKIQGAILAGFENKKPGQYRKEPMFITGSKVKPVKAEDVEREMKKLLEWKENNERALHPLELAAAFHARFEEIHPFLDGNGRTGREILNWMLQKHGWPRAIINLQNRESYILLLERVQLSKEYEKFSRFVFGCMEKRASEIEQILKENKKMILEKLAGKVGRTKSAKKTKRGT
jgi:Fic family protein